MRNLVIHKNSTPHNTPLDWGLESDLILQGDALGLLAQLPAGSVQTTITSPPYWSLRNYVTDASIGLLDYLVTVFREVKRLLGPDGTLWLNVGDAYGLSFHRTSFISE